MYIACSVRDVHVSDYSYIQIKVAAITGIGPASFRFYLPKF